MFLWMKILRRAGVMLGVVVWAARAWAAETPLIPIEDFARISDVYDAKLSPDGGTLGFLAYREERSALSFLDLASGKLSSMRLGTIGSAKDDLIYYKEAADFAWVGVNRAVVFSYLPWNGQSGGLGSVNFQAEDWVGLTGDSRLRISNSKGGELLYNELLYSSGQDAKEALMLEASSAKDYEHPDVVKMDTLTGNYKLTLKNPGDVSGWLTDQTGRICGALVKKDGNKFLRFQSEINGPWRDCRDLTVDWSRIRIVGIYADTLYLLKPGESGHWAVYACDLKTVPSTLRLVYEDPEYDILSADGNGAIGLGRPSPLLFDPASGRLLGIRYMADGPRQHWFDPTLAEVQRQLDAQASELTHTVLGFDRTGKRLLIHSWSAREPGMYSLLNLETRKMRGVAWSRSWAKSAVMAEMYPIKFKARDGLELHGYLTMPPGQGQHGHPAVVMVHDGPWQRDVWGYNPIVQFLASRGYAVLQVNYRGSSGYGEKFTEAGKAELGRAMIDDINDATRWAIAQKFLDPHRVAIMGAGFGGFNALVAMTRAPELYRCGIAAAAMTDWGELVRKKDDSGNKAAYEYWSESLGGLSDPALLRRLTESSPTVLAERFKGPILLAHSKPDNWVPFEQRDLLNAAMRKQGKAVETQRFDHAAHGYPGGDSRVDFLKRLEKFLTKNLVVK